MADGERCGACPGYVLRCAHEGELRVWLISGPERLDETVRRGLGPGRPCSCGRTFEGLPPSPPYAVYGPGVMAESCCACSVALSVPPLVLRWGMQEAVALEDAERLFTFARGIMFALARQASPATPVSTNGHGKPAGRVT